MVGGKSLGWGLVGIGKLADVVIAPVIAKNPDSFLAGVCSRDIERAQDFARRHGASNAYDQYHNLLSDPAVDIVYIATPNAFHKDQAVAALDAGKHVLVEKPMALSHQDGLEMVNAASESGMALGVGFQLRHKASNLAAREAIRNGDLGRIFFCDLAIGAGKSFYPYDTWRADLELAGGGTLLHQGTHVIDLLRFLTDREVLEVSCFLDDDLDEDVFAATCRLEDGMLATLSSQQLHPGTRPDWVVLGEDGWLQGIGATSPMPGDEVMLHRGDTASRIGSSDVPAHDNQIKSFVAAVTGQAPVNGTGEDGLRNIAIFEAMYRSARERRSVEVEGVGSGQI